eukprot:SAG11_NODE_9561_length_900_cov_1.876404_2_plen_172_part_00
MDPTTSSKDPKFKLLSHRHTAVTSDCSARLSLLKPQRTTLCACAATVYISRPPTLPSQSMSSRGSRASSAQRLPDPPGQPYRSDQADFSTNEGVHAWLPALKSPRSNSGASANWLEAKTSRTPRRTPSIQVCGAPLAATCSRLLTIAYTAPRPTHPPDCHAGRQPGIWQSP